MKIEKRIKLKNNYYYVIVDVQYVKDKYGTVLKLINGMNYDGGDFTRLLKKVEKSYSYKKASMYDMEIGLMGDVMYIYDRVPFLSGIRDVYIDDVSIPYSMGYISKEEIDEYIKDHKVKMNKNTRFDLLNEETWII